MCVLQDKTLSATIPDADTSSSKSSLDEDENTSSISDALTTETKDSTEAIDPETSLKPQETEPHDLITVEVCNDFVNTLLRVHGTFVVK